MAQFHRLTKFANSFTPVPWLKLNEEIAVTIAQRRVKFKIDASSMKSASVCLLALVATSSALATMTRRDIVVTSAQRGVQ
ncbi:hypothetical protein Pyn_06228 [Prunus yedoensis var. nudiflora]|uniref:Uncharacterized protein n=1 Tax=Prunus yedoensis var. nudiflora TaxID=2094558 RepID=A0A314XF06_PRUYE|nr:hypothetical protein Pyn_06228 [Prunus yedoensis var. nudiflora]